MPNTFEGSVVIIGWGSVARALVPLLLRGFCPASRMQVIAQDLNAQGCDERPSGLRFEAATLTRENFDSLLGPRVRAGDILLNLGVEVGSADLIAWCQARGGHYLDTSIEPWQGGYGQGEHWLSNYALREQALALRGAGQATAVLAHGANPGLVSHFLKQALLHLRQSALAKHAGADLGPEPSEPAQWAPLAQALGVRVIQIAERDTQCQHPQHGQPGKPPPGQGEPFACTWSPRGFLAELRQPIELGWGSHERALPSGAALHASGCRAAIAIDRDKTQQPFPSVRSWTPSGGDFNALVVSHNEAISIADFLSVHEPDGRVRYRPTVYYAYEPSPRTLRCVSQLQNGQAQTAFETMWAHTLASGHDELGVLVVHDQGALWYGSTLSIKQAKALAPMNSATTLQVAAGILGALVWMLRNPRAGVVEAEQIDHRLVLQVAAPYLGELGFKHCPWPASTHSQFEFLPRDRALLSQDTLADGFAVHALAHILQAQHTGACAPAHP